MRFLIEVWVGFWIILSGFAGIAVGTYLVTAFWYLVMNYAAQVFGETRITWWEVMVEMHKQGRLRCFNKQKPNPHHCAQDAKEEK